MKLEDLHEGIFDKIKQKADDFIEDRVWNVRYIQRMIMKGNVDMVANYILTLPQRQQDLISQRIEKHLEKSNDNFLEYELEQILFKLSDNNYGS